jgi:spore maturation protein CgeB
MDIVVATNGGRWLNVYKEAGVPVCAFIPNPCDPDIQRPYKVNEQWKSDIVFTGKAENKGADCDISRYELLQKLSQKPHVKLYGCFGYPKTDGIETFYAISGAKIALSINRVNNVRLYHSDRLVNCIACGTLTLAKRVPDSDLLFKEGVHLRYFDTLEEFFDLANWYLRNGEERKKIAKAGMERAHTEFNCVKMAQHVLDLVEKGHCDAPWATIL